MLRAPEARRDHDLTSGGSERRASNSVRLGFTAELTVACLTLLGLFVAFRDLPMVDLPQHALQITTWARWNDPAYRPEAYLELNFRTPYLLAYGLARLLYPITGALLALKLVVWLAITLHVVALARLCRRLGYPSWLAVLGIPMGLGYAFYWGFISFSFAIPIGIACFTAALAHAERPTIRSGLTLSLLLCLTLLGHGVALAIAWTGALALVLVGGGTWPTRMAPLAAPVLAAVVWLSSGESMARMGLDVWYIGWWRVASLPAGLVGVDFRDPLALAYGALLLGVVCLCLGRPARPWTRFLPLSIAVAGYLFFPAAIRGYGFMPGRFAAFVLPGLLIAFAPRADGRLVRRGAAMVPAIVALWLLVFGYRLAVFNRDTTAFHALVARLPDNLRVRALIFDRGSSAFPGVPLLLHLTAYYHVEKGGFPAHSFAMYPNSVVRFRRGFGPPLALGAEWHPERFGYGDEADLHDLYVVKSEADLSSALFRGGATPPALIAREGTWRAYASVARPP